jgi:hypothetical protein
MFEVDDSVVIERSIEEVFAFVADNENDPQWCIPVLDTTRIAGDAPGVGARYTFGADAGLMTARGELVIVSFEPPERIAWKGFSPFSHFDGYYELKAVKGGTTILIHSTFTNKMLYRLLEGRMHKQFVINYREQFQKLKALLETQ